MSPSSTLSSDGEGSQSPAATIAMDEVLEPGLFARHPSIVCGALHATAAPFECVESTRANYQDYKRRDAGDDEHQQTEGANVRGTGGAPSGLGPASNA